MLFRSEEQFMSRVPYASAVGSLMYAMLCTRPDICFAVGIVSMFQSKPRPDHWMAVKYIFKYLKRTRDSMLVYSGGDLTRDNTLGIQILIFNQILTPENPHQKLCLLLEEEQSYGGVSSNPVLLISTWKLTMLLHARLPKRLFGSANS